VSGPVGADAGQRGPFLAQGVLIAKLDAAQGAGPGTARVGRDVRAREAGGTAFLRRDAVGGLVVMLRRLADGPEVQLLGPFGQATEWPVFEQPLAPLSHGDASCPGGVMD
jgi:hypothetical protein